MDEAFHQHAIRSRRQNRSSAHLHLSLEPLTTGPPLLDDDLDVAAALLSAPPSTASRRHSYLQSRSPPSPASVLTTPLTRSRSSSRHRFPLLKSQSAAQLSHAKPQGLPRSRSGYGTSTLQRPRNERADSDWLLRAAAVLSSEAREAKGQMWLVSRQSSTSLMAVERDNYSSSDDEDGAQGGITSENRVISRLASRSSRQAHSRSHSRSDGQIDHEFSPLLLQAASDYFPPGGGLMTAGLEPYETNRPDGDGKHPAQYLAGPDFVDLDEALEGLRDTVADDEVAVRRLVRHGKSGGNSWVGRMFGWTLSSLSEREGDGEDEDEDDREDYTDEDDVGYNPRVGDDGTFGQYGKLPLGVRRPRVPGAWVNQPDVVVPAPKLDEGGWTDAAWLLGVATKVLF